MNSKNVARLHTQSLLNKSIYIYYRYTVNSKNQTLVHRVGELHIVEEAACWERKFMLFKVYLRQSVGMSLRPKPYKRIKPYQGSTLSLFSISSTESVGPKKTKRTENTKKN